MESPREAGQEVEKKVKVKRPDFDPRSPLSPNDPGVAKEIRDRLRLLQRTLDESVSPTYHTPTYRDGDRKKLLVMFRNLEVVGRHREKKVEKHRKHVRDAAQEYQHQREVKWEENLTKKHKEHASHLSIQHRMRDEDLKENAKRWQDKHEHSKLKVYNDEVEELTKALHQQRETEKKVLMIEERRRAALKVREVANLEKRNAALQRLEKLGDDNKMKEEAKDHERELRKVEWSRRLAKVEHERVNRIKRTELGRKEAQARYDEATAFDKASKDFRRKEQLRESRVQEMRCRKAEEMEEKKQRQREKLDKINENQERTIKVMAQGYKEKEDRAVAKDTHIKTMKALRSEKLRKQREENDLAVLAHQQEQHRLEAEKLRMMEARWSRRADRCFKYFTGEPPETPLTESINGKPMTA